MAFVVLGAALVALGGLAWRVEGTVKVGVQGFELALRAREALIEARQQAEERDPEEAKRLDEQVAQIDADLGGYWVAVAEATSLIVPGGDLFTQALMHDVRRRRAARRRRRRQEEPGQAEPRRDDPGPPEGDEPGDSSGTAGGDQS